MVRKQEQSIEVFTFPIFFTWNGWIPTRFHGLHMAIFWLETQPFFHYIPTMESIWNGPFHVDSMEFPMNFTLQIYVLFHKNSVEQSTVDKHIKCIVKNSANIKNQTLHYLALPALPITPSPLHHSLPPPSLSPLHYYASYPSLSTTLSPLHHSPPFPSSFNIQCSRINLCSSSDYHSTSYHTIPCHTIPSFQTSHRV